MKEHVPSRVTWNRMTDQNKSFIPNSIDVTHIIVVSHLPFHHLQPKFWCVVYSILCYPVFSVTVAMFLRKAGSGRGRSARPCALLGITQRSRRGLENTGRPTLCSFQIMQDKGKTLQFTLNLNFQFDSVRPKVSVNELFSQTWWVSTVGLWQDRGGLRLALLPWPRQGLADHLHNCPAHPRYSRRRCPPAPTHHSGDAACPRGVVRR